MKCEEFTSMLDAYIDGALSAEDARALTEHAIACEACRAQMESAKLLQDVMRGMDDEIAVPLEAQAAWRSAVRNESARMRRARRMRAFTAVAACVVVICGSVMLIGNRGDNESSMNLAPVRSANEVIASDGEASGAYGGASAASDYTCLKKYAVEDIDAACDEIAQLAEEYGGTFARESLSGEEACRVELARDAMEDFLTSIGRIGDMKDSKTIEDTADPAIIYIQLFKK